MTTHVLLTQVRTTFTGVHAYNAADLAVMCHACARTSHAQDVLALRYPAVPPLYLCHDCASDLVAGKNSLCPAS